MHFLILNGEAVRSSELSNVETFSYLKCTWQFEISNKIVSSSLFRSSLNPIWVGFLGVPS